ncbi:cell division cycle 7-related protein kinase isoform X2 [Nilaparvata lugens]|nr:cell division cycle 7-related protein kinase isoform X2 [Nilaparvata lugens]XP_039288020.1 cell division cycle 7-related protein kinase isoform X2 [Nilaparvata lugens]
MYTMETCNSNMEDSQKYGEKYNSTKRKISSHGYSDRNKISKLLEKIPVLNDFFTLHKKIGEGTFSSVYLASLNSNTDKEEEEECRFAIKHLIPTCSPARIIQEITCLKNIGGTDNVVGLTQCIRKKDNCVFIMPFLPHRKFSDYFLDMDVAEIKLYMRNLLIALRRVHKFKVIHRDVKPANFLYDRETKQFLLVDFGLAENVEKKRDSSDDNVQSSVTENTPVVSKKRKHSHLADENENGEHLDPSEQHSRKRMALHPLTNVSNVQDTPPVLRKAIESPPSLKKAKSASNQNQTKPEESLDAENKFNSKPSKLESTAENVMLSPKRLPLAANNTANIMNNVSPKKHLSSLSTSCVEKKINYMSHSITYDTTFIPRRLDLTSKNEKVFRSLLPRREEKPTGPSYVRVQNSQVQPVFQTPNSNAAVKKAVVGSGATVSQCRCDSRPQVCNICLTRQKQYAQRAGTPGYRPPEVLLKYQHQTTAVDIWAAGVMFISILSGSYPFFQSRDDLISLTEIITIFGTTPVKNLAKKLGKNLICSTEKQPLNLKQVCQRLRRRKLEYATLSPNVKLRLCTTCDHYVFPADGCLCNREEAPDNEFQQQSQFPDEAYDLLGKLLDIDPNTRITAEDALNHPFLIE